MKKRILITILCAALAVSTLTMGAHAAGAGALLDTYGTMSEGNSWYQYNFTLNSAANVQPYVSAYAGPAGDPFMIEWILSVKSSDGQGFTLFSTDIEFEMHQGQTSWHIDAQYLPAGDYTLGISAPEYSFADEDAYGEYVSNGFSYEWSLSLETDSAAAVPAPSTPSAPAPNPSGDEPSEWAKDYVDTAIDLGLVPSDLRSDYRGDTTRAEFCALVVAHYEKFMESAITGRITFTDTSDVNIEKAAYIGVVNGVGDSKFDPHGTLNREQAATMLARLADAVGHPIAGSAAAFNDIEAASEYARVPIGQMQSAGIMSGVAEDRFDAKGPYTREQSIVTVMRLYDYITRLDDYI